MNENVEGKKSRLRDVLDTCDGYKRKFFLVV